MPVGLAQTAPLPGGGRQTFFLLFRTPQRRSVPPRGKPSHYLCHTTEAPSARPYYNIEDLGGHGGGAHPFPFRTGKLSPPAPMVLPKGGRVGRRLPRRALHKRGGPFFYARYPKKRPPHRALFQKGIFDKFTLRKDFISSFYYIPCKLKIDVVQIKTE